MNGVWDQVFNQSNLRKTHPSFGRVYAPDSCYFQIKRAADPTATQVYKFLRINRVIDDNYLVLVFVEY